MQPIVRPLSRWRRKFVFGLLLLAFLVSLPVFIFYATGYRYDLSSPSVIFTATGGFYISAETTGSQIFIDDQEILNARTFRNASYIQGLEPGVHQVHVQAQGFHTWVKQLEVLPHIVTEAESFNVPVIPQVRLVTRHTTPDETSVVFALSTSSPVFSVASTSEEYVVTTSTATSSYQINQEYVILEELFAQKASTTHARALSVSDLESRRFSFATTSTPAKEIATTTIERDGLRLFERENDIFATFPSLDRQDTPFYFCREELLATTTMPLEANKISDTLLQTREVCRSEIRIDRKGELVVDFDFHPADANFVLMQLTSGLYTTEIDDRSWQNSQPVYPGESISFLVYRSGIYIKEGDVIFEVLLELIS